MLHPLFTNFSAALMYRRIGFYGDQRGILRRYRREQQGWDEHLRLTRTFVEQSATAGCSAIVLGSGWLLDVPIETLSKRYRHVTLADLHHPAPVRHQAAALGNVELQTIDISGFAEPVYRYVRQYRYKRERAPLESITPSPLPDWTACDFVLSCNILSQLDIILADYLAQFFDIDEEERSAFRRKVQQTHLEHLPSRACIVTDVEEIALSPEGKELGRRPTVEHPLATRPDALHWRWKFDTHQTYSAGQNTDLEVIAVLY